jgi:hypothetical protein
MGLNGRLVRRPGRDFFEGTWCRQRRLEVLGTGAVPAVDGFLG